MSPIEAPRRRGFRGLATWRARGRRGVAALEFALVVPVLLVVALGLADLVLQMRATYRVERMAGELVNALGQIDPLTGDNLKSVICAANSIGGSNLITANLNNAANTNLCNVTSSTLGAVHVTALDNNNGANRILWSQASFTGAAGAGLPSRITGTPPALPGATIVPSGSQLLAVEVLTQRVRWVTALATPWAITRNSRTDTLYSIAVARPRTATLPSSQP